MSEFHFGRLVAMDPRYFQFEITGLYSKRQLLLKGASDIRRITDREERFLRIDTLRGRFPTARQVAQD